MSEHNPFSASRALADAASDGQLTRRPPGIGRLTAIGCICTTLLIFVIPAIADPFSRPTGFLVAATAFIAIIHLRLKNLGYSGWWMLAVLIPFFHLVLGLELLVAPAGYAQHKTLDLPGRLIVVSIIGAILLGSAFVCLT